MGKLNRKDINRRWEALKTERSSWWGHWEELSDFLLPRSGRFNASDRNTGTRRHNSIYDNTGTRALRTLGSGLMAGATSPARPWFRLATPDPELNAYHSAKLWLDDAGRRMLRVFAKSNVYRTLHGIYEELGCFGTGAAIVLPDFRNVVHCYPLTAGEYAISTDHKGAITTLYREFDMTVAQLVAQFGLEKCSQSTRSRFHDGNLDEWVTVIHAIEPRTDRDPSKIDSRNMEWASIYMEAKGSDGDGFLSESGFRHFPAVCPRWAVAGGDIYGNSPGMEALGDVKGLQHATLRKAEAIDYQTKPPLQAPTSMKNRDVEMLPGGITYVDPTAPNAGIRPAFETRLDLSHLQQDLFETRGRIGAAFYADLFLMLSNAGPNTRMTATEVAERHEEKLLMLGPVLERLHNELLDPLIDMTFRTMLEGGLLPPPPPELYGVDLNVEFVSMLAQAQKAIGTNSIDRFVGNLGVVAQMKPEVLDKVDFDKWADVYSDALGVDPRLIVAGESVAMIRQARNAAMQAKEQAALMQQQAATVKDLGAAPVSTSGQPQSALDVMGMFSGYNSPSPAQV